MIRFTLAVVAASFLVSTPAIAQLSSVDQSIFGMD
jgi:hypothetical protein